MRIIIEVDSLDELERALYALKTQGFQDSALHIVKTPDDPSRAERQEILKRIYQKYQAHLPKGWKFDREAAHER